MSPTTTSFVLTVGGAITVIAMGVLVWTLKRAMKDGPDKMLWWRRAKVVSSFCGLIGLFLLFVSFESQMRDMNDRSKEYRFEEFLDLKFYTTSLKSIACAKDLSNRDAANECFDFNNLDGQVSFVTLREGNLFESVKNWQQNPNLNEAVEHINRRFEQINSTRRLSSERPLLDVVTRIQIALVAFAVIILGLAGSIGEAVYQYRQTKPVTKRS